jgi:hypothetical protein
MTDKEQPDAEIVVMIGVPLKMVKVMERVNEVALVSVLTALSDLSAGNKDKFLTAEVMEDVMDKVRIMLKLKSALREMIEQGEKAHADVAAEQAVAKAMSKDGEAS